MKTLKDLEAETVAHEKRHRARTRRTGKFSPETIVVKFFSGELFDRHGEIITVERIGDATTWEIRDNLLDCLKRYHV